MFPNLNTLITKTLHTFKLIWPFTIVNLLMTNLRTHTYHATPDAVLAFLYVPMIHQIVIISILDCQVEIFSLF
jgi:hypothetical protein